MAALPYPGESLAGTHSWRVRISIPGSHPCSHYLSSFCIFLQNTEAATQDPKDKVQVLQEELSRATRRKMWLIDVIMGFRGEKNYSDLNEYLKKHQVSNILKILNENEDNFFVLRDSPEPHLKAVGDLLFLETIPF